MMHVLIFGMLDTPQLVTPFNPLSSQNAADNCDHATFNVDCSYDILKLFDVFECSLRHLLNFRPYITPQRKPFEIFYDCLQTILFFRSGKAVVL